MKLVSISRSGTTLLRELRARKTAWLSTRLAELSDDDLRILDDAVDILERLAAPPTPTTNPSDAGITP